MSDTNRPAAILRAKLAVDTALMSALNALLYMLARPVLRMATGSWPKRDELANFRAAFAEGHHHLPRLFFALSRTKRARFYLIDTMLAACRGVPPTPTEAASHAALAGAKVAFMHIEKTAGSSVTGFLERRYALTQIMPLPVTAEAAAAALRDPAAGAYALIHGHYDLPALRAHAPDRLVVTFLRDPAARIVSAYYYWRSAQLSKESADVNQAAVMAARLGLLDFLRCELPVVRDQIDNLYTRRLTGLSYAAVGDPLTEDPLGALDRALQALDSLAFVGITERMTESLTLLSDRLGLVRPAHAPRINVGVENVAIFPADFAPVARETLTPDIDAELRHLTRLDRILYTSAARRLGAQAEGVF